MTQEEKLNKRRAGKRISEAKRRAKMSPTQIAHRKEVNRIWFRNRMQSLSVNTRNKVRELQRIRAKKSRAKRKTERTPAERQRLRELHNKATKRFYVKLTKEQKLDRYERRRARVLAKLEQIAGRPKPTTCELCENGGQLAFDHDHGSGRFRGWLCERCNLTLGQVGDSVEILLKMIAYLQQHKTS